MRELSGEDGGIGNASETVGNEASSRADAGVFEELKRGGGAGMVPVPDRGKPVSRDDACVRDVLIGFEPRDKRGFVFEIYRGEIVFEATAIVEEFFDS